MKRTIRLIAAGALIALAACKNPAPPATPPPPAPTVTGYGETPPTIAAVPGTPQQRFLASMDVPGQWWTLFHSTQLNALVAEALAANPDVAAAQAALRSARETYAAQRASAYPNVQGSFGVTRQQDPLFYSPPTTNNATYIYGVHTLSLDVAYTPDVFGNFRYQTLAAAAAAEDQRYEVEATYLTLTSNVVTTVVQIASLRDQIAANDQIIALERQLLGVTRSQRQYGQVTGLDVATQEAALDAAQQALPALDKQLRQQRDLLARLLGQSPGEPVDTTFALSDLHLPDDLPLSLPSKLVQQRPDILAASTNLAAASAQVGVAYTNRLPNFQITSQTATQALSLGGLFGVGSLLSTLTAQVATTFYDQGTLKHRETAAVAAYDEAAAQYKGAVLSGFQNVADALAALSTDADALNASVTAAHTADRALGIVRQQLAAGQVSSLATLNAEQTLAQAQLNVVQAQANRYADTAALFAALGGGWWNRADIPPHS